MHYSGQDFQSTIHVFLSHPFLSNEKNYLFGTLCYLHETLLQNADFILTEILLMREESFNSNGTNFFLFFGNGLYLEHVFRLYCNLKYPLTYVCAWKMSSLCIWCLSSWKKLLNFQLERICHSCISFRDRITSVVYYRVWANTTKGS